MELSFKGANVVVLSVKGVSVVTDPASAKSVYKLDKKTTIQLLTEGRFATEIAEETFTISGPGEYEVAGVSVRGIPAQRHIDESAEASTMYRITAGGFQVAILGHVAGNLNDAQLEALGTVDVLMLPVGGHGYTLDAVGAAKVVRAIEPKIVIPTHYEMPGVTYEVPQAPVEEFLKEMGVTEPERIDKFKLKGDLPEKLTVVVLDKS